MFAEIVGLLAKLPPELVNGVVSLVKMLVDAETDHDRRVAMDAAMAAAEKSLLERQFPRG